MSSKKIYLGPKTYDEGRFWCEDNAWLESEQEEVDEYIHSSDPRLSSDPLTALAAVMREHKLIVIADGGVIISSGDSVIVADPHYELAADDIKPEPSNKTSCYCGKNKFIGDQQRCCDDEDCIPC